MVSFILVLLAALGVRDTVALLRVNPVVSFPPITPTSTSTSALSDPTPVLFFHAIDQLTACQPATISWVYDGPASPLSLLVTNDNVGQTPILTSSATGVRTGIDVHSKRKSQDDPGTITETLSTSADPFAFNYTWPSVKLPQGYYAILASVPGFSTESTPFFILNGTDVSCLQATTSSSASSSATPASTSSSTQTPVGSGASSNNGSSHTAAIVGGVIGGVVAIFAVIGCLLLRLFRKRSGRGQGSSNRWGGLNSTDLGSEPKESATAGSKRHRFGKAGKTHSTSESVGAITAATESTKGHSSNNSHGTVDALSPVRETPLDNAGPFATPLHSNTPDPFEDTTTPLPTPARRASLNRDHSAYNRAYSSSNVILSPSVRRASMDGYRPEAIPMALSSSASSAARRTGRKPVPQYDASELEGTPPESSVLGHDDADGSLSGHYNLTSTPPSVTALSSTLGVRSSPSPGGFSPKGEFADPSRPVHYLIPDMPPSGMSRS